jgi:Ca-activated chloride channel family protein
LTICLLYCTFLFYPFLKYLLTITIGLLLHVSLSAQQQYYMKGEVRNENGDPLQNVMIRLQSTGYVYYSGASGGFGIITTKQFDTLSFFLDGYEKQTATANATGFINIALKHTPSTKNTRGYALSSFTQNLEREVQQQWFVGDETYASLIENRAIPAMRYPTTGITLNVDRASYSNIRRFITLNTQVPPDAVRIEEMLNYFNLSYTEPDSGKIFGIETLLTRCPWNSQNQLLFTSIKSKRVLLDSLPPSNLVFLIDVSGSMDMPNRLPLLQAGFRSLVNNLRPKDSVAIVVYGGITGVMLNTTSGGEKEKIFRAIDSLSPGGATPGESGIKLAYSVARTHFVKGGNNRVILATDGDFNVGSKTDDELEELITAQTKSGIYLTCLGVGMGNYKDSKIQTLAQKGHGNFAYLDSYNEAEKVLLKEFTQTLYTVADNVYLNATFNPDYVKSYRVIGFDNKVGALKDTTAIVEGGEIGSAYNLQVLFEIEPTTPDTMRAEKPVTFSLQYMLPHSAVEHQLKLAPTVQYQPWEKIPQCHQFAGTIALFGQMLRGSNYVKDINWNEMLAMATKYSNPNDVTQQEFVSLVQQAKTLYTKHKRRRE